MAPALDSPAPKLRNKLRKLSKRRPESIVSNVSPRVSTDSKRDSGRDLGEAQARQVPKSPSHRTSLPAPPPDLSDPKWQEYVRKSGLVLPMEKSPLLKQTHSPSPPNLIPEFAHLAITSSPKIPDQHNKSAEELPPLPSPHSTLSSSSSAMRRYAKTPVTRIGQLEGESSPTRLGHKATDVELIAEQYRALLDAHSYEDLHADPLMNEQQEADEWHDARTRQNSLDTIRSAVSRRSPLPPPLPPPRQLTPPGLGLDLDAEGSPTSDGTLVDFEEDAIYFKPAFSPEALSPIPEDEDFSPLSSPLPPRSDALSLQITMELLTKELAGSLRRNRPRRGGAATNVPPLQTWLMIEAYEKLRDQVLDMHLPVEEAHALQDVFDVWLRALYRVHEGLAEADAKMVYVPGEGEVEALQTVDLD